MLAFAAEVARDDRAALADAVQRLQALIGVGWLEESRGRCDPLGGRARGAARPAGKFGQLEVYHFDPSSAAFRLIARGDEPDYDCIVTFLRPAWLVVDKVNALPTGLLPRFTSEIIQQDPAEFRCKFKGLPKMWRAAQACLACDPLPKHFAPLLV